MRGRCAGSPARADPARRLEAVHLGHLHVHQHHVVGLALHRLDRLDAVRREVGAIAHLLQQAQRELLVHHVVLGQQDAQRVARRHAAGRAAAWPRVGRPGRRVVREQADQRVEQVRLADRLGEERVEQRLVVADLAPAQRAEQDQRQRRRAARGSAARARRRPSPACACRGSRGRTPRRRRASAAPRARTRWRATVMPHFAICRLSTRRLVALSSTTSTRRPCEPRLRADEFAPALRRQRRRPAP